MDIRIEPGDDLEEFPDLFIPVGAAWIPNPAAFCKARGFTAITHTDQGLFGLTAAGRWEPFERDSKLKAV